MSLLENLKPTKKTQNYQITTYNEDMELFLDALEYLQTSCKSTGKFTAESLFEHLTSPLREDPKLMEFAKNRPKRRSRSSRERAPHEKKSEVAR